MSNLIIIGTQWGDEEGKIVDLLSAETDTIVGISGTMLPYIVIGDQNSSLLLPSGIIRNNKIVVIGNGVVLDPWKLLEEITN